MIDRVNAKDLGIHSASFSFDDRYIVVKDNGRPSVLWIWDVKRDRLRAQLVFVSPVLSFAWNLTRNTLAIVTSNQTLYFWESDSIVWVLLPNRKFLYLLSQKGIIGMSSIEWRPSGDCLLIVGGDTFQICRISSYPVC